jgi:3-hydroxymyristoyl/3-hydroxydecanoyl-(acyl carrier protein) dehydratase
VAVNEMSNAPVDAPITTEPPEAVQVSVFAAIEQLRFAAPVTPDALLTLAVA